MFWTSSHSLIITQPVHHSASLNICRDLQEYVGGLEAAFGIW